MAHIEAALIQIRDAAHLNQGALGAVLAEAETHFQAVRLWADSAVKRELLGQLATVIQAYRNGNREALELRNRAGEALEAISGDAIPPLPGAPGDGGVVWSQMDW